MVVLFSLLTRGILSEECISYHPQSCGESEVVKSRTNLTHIFQTGGDGEAQKWIITGKNYQFVPKMPIVLDEVAHSRVVVEGWG